MLSVITLDSEEVGADQRENKRYILDGGILIGTSLHIILLFPLL